MNTFTNAKRTLAAILFGSALTIISGCEVRPFTQKTREEIMHTQSIPTHSQEDKGLESKRYLEIKNADNYCGPFSSDPYLRDKREREHSEKYRWHAPFYSLDGQSALFF